MKATAHGMVPLVATGCAHQGEEEGKDTEAADAPIQRRGAALGIVAAATEMASTIR